MHYIVYTSRVQKFEEIEDNDEEYQIEHVITPQ